MELYKEILSQILSQTAVQVTFPDLHMDAGQLVKEASYAALKQIKAVLEDSSLDDESCFMKIEEIVRIFEGLGSSCGGRHDFG